MCTVISDNNGRHTFGRTLDLECSYGESVILTPRSFPFSFLYEGDSSSHRAMIGMGITVGGVPLYYDAMNESGLCAAALNFPGRAVYRKKEEGKLNLASFEIIPFVLSRCENLREARKTLSELNVTDDAVLAEMPPTPLHWMVFDKDGALVIEATKGGVQISDNPHGVLTNSPEVSFHLENLALYMGLNSRPPENKIAKGCAPEVYSRGLGAVGLPGDFSSPSRFVRAVFLKNHTHAAPCGCEVIRTFHIMNNLSVPDGAVSLADGQGVRTVYTAVGDTQAGIYYFSTYEDPRIRGVRLLPEGAELSVLPASSGEWDDGLLKSEGVL